MPQVTKKSFQRGEKYRLRKLRSNDGKVRVLEEITCPSATDLNDSDGETVPVPTLKRGDKNNNKEAAYKEDSDDEHSTTEGGVETVAAESEEGEEEEEHSEVIFLPCAESLRRLFRKSLQLFPIFRDLPLLPRRRRWSRRPPTTPYASCRLPASRWPSWQRRQRRRTPGTCMRRSSRPRS